MNWLFTLLMCAMLTASVAVVRADDARDKRLAGDDTQKRKEDRKKLLPEERDSKKDQRKTNNIASREDSDKRREQLKNMTPEERAAKRQEIKARLEKRIAELRDKQTNATISAQEARELDRREQILKRFEQEAPNMPRIERARPVFTNSPVKK